MEESVKKCICGERLKTYGTQRKGDSVTVKFKICPKCGKKLKTISIETIKKD